MGILKCGKLNLNDANVVKNLINAVNELVQIHSSYYSLKFKPSYYFEAVGAPPPSDRGWYIIIGNGKPIYVGKADDLNARLNTNNGSIDDFANKSRAFDSERNFIKKFAELNIFGSLEVCIIKENDLCSKLGISPEQLLELDRKNVEKVINIFRQHFNYLH
jgi:hypothetical protein